ncbi:uncharacterized protein LOC126705166 [Quercus robur]|uniref:uncharacterized protein LOC126705166 n=1 Tax=Quercus robur TaxID=38942 RepID=UPI002163578B|nr:uncharacterized protein LOC126705166 [Quercus robur]
MSAGLDGVLGRPKAEWTPSRDAYLVELFIEQHNLGRTAYNEYKNVIRSVTHDFNKKFGTNLEENQIKNRYNVMKKDYGIVKALLSNTVCRMVVADDKVWDSYITVRSEARPFRRKSFPLYKQMSIIFEGERANGKKLASQIPRIQFEHCYREANRSADMLARMGANQSSSFSLHSSPPEDVKPLLEFDNSELYLNRRYPITLVNF